MVLDEQSLTTALGSPLTWGIIAGLVLGKFVGITGATWLVRRTGLGVLAPGLTVYKMELMGLEGFFMSALLLLLPFVVLYVLTKILPPWPEAEARVVRLVRLDKPMVLDADALNLLSAMKKWP